MLCVNFLTWDMEWIWSFLFGLCLIYVLASTNNNKQNSSLIPIFPFYQKKKIPIFPSDNLFLFLFFFFMIGSDNLFEKHQHTHKLNTITKTKTQNIHKKFKNWEYKKINKNLHKRTKNLNGCPLFCFFIVNFLWYYIQCANSKAKNNE